MLKAGQDWAIHHGDCIPHMLEDMPENSVDMAVFSPPFPSLYAYTSSESDVGNVDTMAGEAQVHLSFMFNGLARVLKPGRVAVVHVCQIPRFKRTGGVGLCDFRGINIRLGERAGLVYEYDWMVRRIRRHRQSARAAGNCNLRGWSRIGQSSGERCRII